jgi:hypothetical protein
MSYPETELMLAHLENKRIEGATEYARRGRLLELVPDEDLSRDWLLAFRAWAASERGGQKYDHRALEDIEAEMYLRGCDPPLDLAREEIKILHEASERRRDELKRDPMKHSEFERKLSEDLAAFAQSIDDTKKN